MTTPIGRLPRLALVGAGRSGRAYLDVFANDRVEAELVAVVDTDTARLAVASGVATFADIHSLIEQQSALRIDAIILATPPVTHAPIAAAALDANLAVLCEKPIAPNRPGLHMMFDAAERNDQLLMMASKFRYAEDVLEAKRIIDSGDLGEIVLFRNAFTRPQDMRGRWNARPELSGGGVIIDEGTHSVDIARYLLGPLRQVIAVETRRVQGLPVEDTAQILFRTDAGATGTIDLSWSLHSGSPWFVTLDGTKGSLRLGWDGAEINRGHGWESFGQGYDEAEAFGRKLTDFAEALRYGKSPLIDVDDAQASVAVIDAAYRSMQTGAWVRVVEERRAQRRW